MYSISGKAFKLKTFFTHWFNKSSPPDNLLKCIKHSELANILSAALISMAKKNTYTKTLILQDGLNPEGTW